MLASISQPPTSYEYCRKNGPLAPSAGVMGVTVGFILDANVPDLCFIGWPQDGRLVVACLIRRPSLKNVTS